MDVLDYAEVLHLKDDYRISEKKIQADDWMANKTLGELNLRHEGITVLGIDRVGSDYIGSPTGGFDILPMDVVTVYGKAEVIQNIYARKDDYKASVSHKEFVEREDKRLQDKREDTSTDV